MCFGGDGKYLASFAGDRVNLVVRIGTFPCSGRSSKTKVQIAPGNSLMAHLMLSLQDEVQIGMYDQQRLEDQIFEMLSWSDKDVLSYLTNETGNEPKEIIQQLSQKMMDTELADYLSLIILAGFRFG